MAAPKSWTHLTDAAKRKGVVIYKGIQGLASVKTVSGEYLFSWRNTVMQNSSEKEFNDMVDKMLA